jgi:hypothetical protein
MPYLDHGWPRPLGSIPTGSPVGVFGATRTYLRSSAMMAICSFLDREYGAGGAKHRSWHREWMMGLSAIGSQRYRGPYPID